MTSARQTLFFALHRLFGKRRGDWYLRYCREDRQGVPEDTTRLLLIRLLAHAAQSVPYYAEIMAPLGNSFRQDPEACLAQLPILTKEEIHHNFERLKATDLARRRWFYNGSGGSTGEPVQLIQDQEYADHQMAIQDLSLAWAGREFGEPTVFLWGAMADLWERRERASIRLLDWLANYTLLDAFRMTPAQMKSHLDRLNRRRPKLIVAYAQAIYELARFAEKEGITVVPQTAILTSASTLYPFMREKIEQVFGCRVFDRYGCREAGDIACECQFHTGLHVFPWVGYVEVVDEDGHPVPPGVEGNILVTSLLNYAMPLIRYKLEDRGILAANVKCPCGRKGQLLQQVTGRAPDSFRTRGGQIVSGLMFSHVIGVELNRGTIRQFQAVQEDYDHVHVLMVKRSDEAAAGLPVLRSVIEKAMGAGVQIDVEFVKDIPPSASGKYRYTISHVSS